MTGTHWVATVERHEGESTVQFVGEIDLSNAARFRAYLLGVVSMVDDVVSVDLRGISYLDSTALYGLIAAAEAAEQRAVQFQVIADGLPRDLIELTGLHSLFRRFREPAS